ncbi:hypothetical protein PGH12_02015 [Chryseobacterium wangxinyae]|nr:hypothetical protein [Chryseobacterium sp. CY350]MCY0979303.1 hypothetical protein [Chryseobacterium sp. CY350]WBZ95935.1 hypothetical protein PGH12_02015 [Chryseobacterium sp. CY350]
MPERIKISENLQILVSVIVGGLGGILARLALIKLKIKNQKEDEKS